MKRRINRLPSPAIVVAVAALVAALGGAAVAQPVANKAVTKKKVKKIADKEIAKKAPGLSVAHADTADTADTATNANAVGGQALANIAVARSVNPGGPACDPTSATLVNCATVNMTLPHEGRVLLLGTAGQIAFTAAGTQGDCLFRVDGVNSGGSVHVGNQYVPTPVGATAPNFPNGFSNTVVTDPVPAGDHAFSLACSESAADVAFVGPQISAVLVGSG